MAIGTILRESDMKGMLGMDKELNEYKVYPIKDFDTLHKVQETLLNNFRLGRRNYTIFQVGKGTILRVSDVLSLKYDTVFQKNGKVRSRATIKEQKTGKVKCIYLKPVEKDLIEYQKWLIQNKMISPWLFPSANDPKKCVTRKNFYKIMQNVGELLDIDYLGTHTMRKTGAYLVYQQTNKDIGLVMKLLNHSDQSATLHYLGLDQETIEQALDKIKFD